MIGGLQVSHLLNKPIESICGYLTVLPGAFSAFRWAAVEVRVLYCRDAALPACQQHCSCLPLAGSKDRSTASSAVGPLHHDSFLPVQSANLPTALLPCPPTVQGEPLRRYFYGLYSQNDLSAFEANMYLAEDRVLCLEIVARKNSKY